MTYASGSWIIRTMDRQCIDAFKMFCWQRMLRIMDGKAHECINPNKAQHQGEELTMNKTLLKYFGHIMR